MAKLIETPVTATDLSEYLQSTDDFAFELDVYRLCLAHDSHARHGGTYQDPVTKNDRQFDIRLQIAGKGGVVKMAVECKNLKPYFPLLISRVPRGPTEAFQDVFLHRRERFDHVRSRGERSMYRRGFPVGKSTSQVGRRTAESAKNSPTPFLANDEEAYDKWTQAISSAYDLVIHSQPESIDLSLDEERRGIVVLPALVVPENTLWVVDYLEDGTQKAPPEQVEECTLFIGKSYKVKRAKSEIEYIISHLHFFTKPGLQKFLKAVENEDYWEDMLPSSTYS